MMTMSRLSRLVVLLVLSTPMLISAAETTTFNVALWGDIPYLGTTVDVFDPTDPEELKGLPGVSVGTLYQQLRDSINDSASLFSFHTGDIKLKTNTCLGGDANPYWQRFQDLANSLTAPVFYTPGGKVAWDACVCGSGQV